jgi:gamma-glutamylcyclotransferase (GGCT)/AIG2-like uncharacterized protein YtfP
MDCERAQLLFVYGTLKRGGSNHHWLQGAGWRGRARLAGHRLHNLGDYPMAVPGRGVVHGEVYAVDDAALARLDRLEDVPNEYQRRICPLEDGRQGWVYFGTASQVRGLPRVPYADWQSIPVFHYGSDLDPAGLRRRVPSWDGTAWLARLPGWRWQATGDALCRRGIAALIRPDPQSACWGVVTHEPRGGGLLPWRPAEGSAQGRAQAPPQGGAAGPAADGVGASPPARSEDQAGGLAEQDAGGPTEWGQQEGHRAGWIEGVPGGHGAPEGHGAPKGHGAPAVGRPAAELGDFAKGPAKGWRAVSLRLEPWQQGSRRTPVGALARVWWPEAGRLPLALAGAAEVIDPQVCRERVLAGAVHHGLPDSWCQFLRQAMADPPRPGDC